MIRPQYRAEAFFGQRLNTPENASSRGYSPSCLDASASAHHLLGGWANEGRGASRVRQVTLAGCCSVALLGAGGCGGEEDSGGGEAAAPETVTVERTVKEAAPPQPKPKPSPSPVEKPPPPADSGGIAVPNVVGKDHQLAQDTLQAAGLYLLQEEDATGQGRLLLLDRNWVVVSQDPPAGTTVSEDATITLSAKMDDE